jgi:hypothetical protein
MLTLKVITTNLEGQVETNIFSGDSIAHTEFFSTDHCIIEKLLQQNSSIWVIGNMTESSSEQKFIASNVYIYDDDRSCKNQLFIVPKAECYIMDNGKTIDSFTCTYEQKNLNK